MRRRPGGSARPVPGNPSPAFLRSYPGLPFGRLTLAIALYLTVIELRELEPRPHFTYWGWWLSLVFLTHFIGYFILRGYAAYRRRSQARA